MICAAILNTTALAAPVPADGVYLFATFTTHDASISDPIPPVGGSFGSREGADYFVNLSIDSASVLTFEFDWYHRDVRDYHFKALLSIETQGARDRMVEHIPQFLERPVTNLYGQTVANRGADLFASDLNNADDVQLLAPLVDNFGQVVPDNTRVWTGTSVDGSPAETADNWSNPLISAAYGTVGSLGGRWLNDGLQEASFGYRLYGVGILTAPLPGDYNNDYRVDAADYAVWRENLGSTLGMPNDMSPVGPIGAADFEVWRSNFGAQRLSTTVTLVDDDAPFYAMGNGGELNVMPGGIVGNEYDVGTVYDEPFASQLNLSGGQVGDYLEVLRGGTVAVHSGTVGENASILEGGVMRIAGGAIGQGLTVMRGGILELAGGEFSDAVLVQDEGFVTVTGGTVEFDLQGAELYDLSGNKTTRDAILVDAFGGLVSVKGKGNIFVRGGVANIQLSLGTAYLHGGDFFLDGTSVAGLEEEGNTVDIAVSQNSIVTGTLTDGTPLIFSGLVGDSVQDGILTLRAASIPPRGPSQITASTDPVPLGIRNGQTLVVDPGASVNAHFRATDSSIEISGGSIGDDLRAVRTDVELSSGSIGKRFAALNGTQVSMTGGILGAGIDVFSGATLSMTGGESPGGVEVHAGGVATIAGGRFGGFLDAKRGSEVIIAGGGFGDDVDTHDGSSLTIEGGEFRVDGVLIGGLENVGDTVSGDVPNGAVLSGTLADGTPFSFTTLDGDNFAPGTLSLRRVILPSIDSTTITASSDNVPLGLRTGQTLLVDSGAFVENNFHAGRGSAMVVQPGGVVGTNLEAVEADVNILGGEVGNDFDAFFGSTLNLFSGQVGTDIGNQVDIFNGGVVNISGGTILGDISVHEGGQLNIAGGQIRRLGRAQADTGGSIQQSGGFIQYSLEADSGGILTVSGGTLGRLRASSGSMVRIVGGEFHLNGIPIEGLDTAGSSVSLNVPSDAVISGTLADGTPFAYSTYDDDTLGGGILTIEAAALPSIGPAVTTASIDVLPYGIRNGQTLRVDSGGSVGDNFNAGAGSQILVESGGVIGDNLELVGATMHVSGGIIGKDFDAFSGSTIIMSDGTIDSPFSLSGGSSLVMSGGSIELIENMAGASHVTILAGVIGAVGTLDPAMNGVDSGSTLTVSGGAVENDIVLWNGGIASVSGGSIGRLLVRNGSSLSLSGGNVGNNSSLSGISVSAEGTARISGGTFDHLTASGSIEISGGDFRLDGLPIAGLESPGDILPLSVPDGGVLTGVLSDGTPFAISTKDGDVLAAGTLLLEATSIPPVGPATIVASNGAIPLGIRNGQSLIVDSGAVVPGNFNAGAGSSINIDAGGYVSANLEVVAAQLNINGGEIGDDLAAYQNSVITFLSGSIGDKLQLFDGSELVMQGGSVGKQVSSTDSAVEIMGGIVGDQLSASGSTEIRVSGGALLGDFAARDQSAVLVSGGTLNRFTGYDESSVTVTGGSFSQDFVINPGAAADIQGGLFETVRILSIIDVEATAQVGGGVFMTRFMSRGSVIAITGGDFVGQLVLESGATADIMGGHYNDISVDSASRINLLGTDFAINGNPLLELVPGEPFLIEDYDILLTGTFSDGSPFAFDLANGNALQGQYINPFATLTLTLVESPALLDHPDGSRIPEPSSLVSFLVALCALCLVRIGGNR